MKTDKLENGSGGGGLVTFRVRKDSMSSRLINYIERRSRETGRSEGEILVELAVRSL